MSWCQKSKFSILYQQIFKEYFYYYFLTSMKISKPDYFLLFILEMTTFFVTYLPWSARRNKEAFFWSH
jgi:hypothetical protein